MKANGIWGEAQMNNYHSDRKSKTPMLKDAGTDKSEQKYHTLWDSIDEGYCIIEVLFDKDQRPIDHRFLEVNAAFEL